LTDAQRTVALLIDYDNLQICYSRDAPGTQLDLGAVMAFAQSYGQVVIARAYAEWNLLSERLAVYKAGIEPAFAPVLRPEGSNREGKSLADTVMVADGVDLIWTHAPDVLVLVTSDKDMIPLARLAKQRGITVVVLGSDLTAVPLLEMANDFVTYRHLVRELGRPEERGTAPPAREEPRVRRVRGVAAAREATLREPRTLPSRTRERRAAPLAPVEPAPAAELPEEVAAGEPTIGAQLDENGQPIAPRRRRRRGGRGRRTGLVPGGALEAGEGEALDELGEPEPEAEAMPVGEMTSAEARTEAEPTSDQSAEAPAEAPAEPALPRVLRVRPSRPTIRPGPQSASSAGELKPWERWPEPTRTSEPAEAEQPTPAAEPAAEEAAPAAEAAAPEAATQADESPTTEAPAPARRRRSRGSGRATAKAAAAEAAEVAPDAQGATDSTQEEAAIVALAPIGAAEVGAGEANGAPNRPTRRRVRRRTPAEAPAGSASE
jgi:uncharacterized LabA/DUF88 family protein